MKCISTVDSLHRVDLKPFQTLGYSLKPLARYVCCWQIPASGDLIGRKTNLKPKRAKCLAHKLSWACLPSNFRCLSQVWFVSLLRFNGKPNDVVNINTNIVWKSLRKKGRMIKRQLSTLFHWFTTQPQGFLILFKGLGKTLEDYLTIHSYAC